MPAQADNPKGFGESLSVVRLNDAILATLGASWRSAGPFLSPQHGPIESHAAIQTAVRDRWLAAAQTVLESAYSDATAIVIKDPRVALFPALWREALAAAGYAASYVMIYRNPLEVCASLEARNAMPRRHALGLWLRYNLECLVTASDAGLETLVNYNELLRDPAAVLERVLPGGAVDDLAAARAKARDFVSLKDRHQKSEDAALINDVAAPRLVKDAWLLMRSWHAFSPEVRAAEVVRLQTLYNNVALLAVDPVFVTPQEAATAQVLAVASRPRQTAPPKAVAASPAPAVAAPVVQPAAQAPLVLHYHLFKNAGTSVDKMLKRNFGDRWETAEFKAPGLRSNAAEVTRYLRARPALAAFSSHTALMPLPDLGQREVLPIFFIRHPIDRLRSAYAFERKQGADTWGARMARENDFAGYIRALINTTANRQGRNFQTWRLSMGESGDDGDERSRALRVVNALPFIGLVENYEGSLGELQKVVCARIPDFVAVAAHENRSERESKSLEERIAGIREELGEQLYESIALINADDFAVYEEVRSRYAPG